MSDSYRVAILHDVLRREEKLLVEAFRRVKTVELTLLDDREIAFSPSSVYELDAVLSRTVSFSRGLYARRLFESRGVLCINSARVAETCGDKLLTSLALERAAVPQPEFRAAFDETDRSRGDGRDGVSRRAEAGHRLLGTARRARRRSRLGGKPSRAPGCAPEPHAPRLLPAALRRQRRLRYPRIRRRRSGHRRHPAVERELAHQHSSGWPRRGPFESTTSSLPSAAPPRRRWAAASWRWTFSRPGTAIW